MDKNLLGDSEIRIALKKSLKNVPLLVEEFEFFGGKSRVDFFLYDDFFTGIEIKSERDTLDRLPRQIEHYNQCLEKIEIVVGANHLEQTLQMIPKWWGASVACRNNDSVAIKRYRHSKPNPLFKPELLVEFLWRDEMVDLLEHYGQSKGIKSRGKFELKSIARNFISYEELKYFVFKYMINRSNWKSGGKQS